LSRSNRRREHAQGAWSDLVVEWRSHRCDFPVERHQQPLPACADIGSRALDDAKIALLLGKLEHATAGKPEHRKPALRLGNVKAQLATIESLPRAKPRHGDSILIVSDQHARAAARLDMAFDLDGQPE
jgi:hypothetical protein